MATSKLVTVVLVLLLRISLFWDAALAVPSSITKPPFRQGSSPGPWPNLPEDVDDPALEKRQSTIAKVCDPATPGICWIEMYRSTALPRFRVAFPDTASPPFDALLQIISPVAVGWAGWCWGGRMVNNPLTIAWQNGQNVTVTSRWAR